MSARLELTGLLGATDPQGRLRLCLVERLGGGDGALDETWRLLRREIPGGPGLGVPYRLDHGGRPDAAGVLGDCWVTVPAGQKNRVAAYARELRGREVGFSVRPKRYGFVSQAAHNRGRRVAGTALVFAGGLGPLPAASGGPARGAADAGC